MTITDEQLVTGLEVWSDDRCDGCHWGVPGCTCSVKHDVKALIAALRAERAEVARLRELFSEHLEDAGATPALIAIILDGEVQP